MKTPVNILLVDDEARNLDEEALRASEERFRLLIEGAPNAMLMVDDTGAVTVTTASNNNWPPPAETIARPRPNGEGSGATTRAALSRRASRIPASRPDRLAELLRKLVELPEGFRLHPKLAQRIKAHEQMAAGERPLDWAAAESLAFATLATQSVRIRLTGQDTARGTFSQRHAILFDQEIGYPYVPLQHLAADQAPVEIVNSPLNEDNLQIVHPTTPAQYFHCLRRQALWRWRKPLVVFTPKSLLRHPKVVSTLEDCARGRFQRVLPDTVEPRAVKRVLLCSGKVYHELAAHREDPRREDVAIVRLEQLYPLRDELLERALAPYPDATPVFWVQEEPENMEAWRYLRGRFDALFGVAVAPDQPAGIGEPRHRFRRRAPTGASRIDPTRVRRQGGSGENVRACKAAAKKTTAQIGMTYAHRTENPRGRRVHH
jgi:hypothetical protein